MGSQKRRSMALLFSLVFSGIMLMQAWNYHFIIQGKSIAQELIIEGLNRWKQQYLAVNESRIKWENSYLHEDKIQDVAALIQLVDFPAAGLTSDPDTIALTKVEQVTQDQKSDMPLGLTRICMSSGTADGYSLQVSAPTYQLLLDGLDRLAKRPDIQIGSISVEGDKKVPIAKLGDFCVLLRNG